MQLHFSNIEVNGNSFFLWPFRFWNTVSGMPLNCIDTGSQVCNLVWAKNVNEIVSTHGYSQNQVVIWRYPTMSKLVSDLRCKEDQWSCANTQPALLFRQLWLVTLFVCSILQPPQMGNRSSQEQEMRHCVSGMYSQVPRPKDQRHPSHPWPAQLLDSYGLASCLDKARKLNKEGTENSGRGQKRLCPQETHSSFVHWLLRLIFIIIDFRWTVWYQFLNVESIFYNNWHHNLEQMYSLHDHY